MKIAFVVSFFDFRNDVRRLIAEAATRHEVVVLGQAKDAEAIGAHLPAGVTFRPIRERKDSTRNAFWERIYLLFRKIPRSRANFFLMELFKASNQPTHPLRARALRLFRQVQRLPKFIAYDTYLNRLDYRADSELSDIESFICFTAIADDYLLARLIREREIGAGLRVQLGSSVQAYLLFEARRLRLLVGADSERYYLFAERPR